MVGKPVGANEFVREIGVLKRRIPRESMNKLVKAVALRALRQVVFRSPVGNPDLWQSPAPPGYVGGQFRNNWFVEVGNINPDVRERASKSGSESLSEGVAEIGRLSTANRFQVVYIHNSLPYALRLEEGWSKQAPLGIVALTADSFRNWRPDLFQ